MPPHLQLTLLNVPPAMDATASLPRPQHVILNHLYIQRSSQNANALVVGTTHRYEAAEAELHKASYGADLLDGAVGESGRAEGDLTDACLTRFLLDQMETGCPQIADR